MAYCGKPNRFPPFDTGDPDYHDGLTHEKENWQRARGPKGSNRMIEIAETVAERAARYARRLRSKAGQKAVRVALAEIKSLPHGGGSSTQRIPAAPAE